MKQTKTSYLFIAFFLTIPALSYSVDPPGANPSPAASSIKIRSTTGSLGTYLVDQNGKSLYLFKADQPNDSRCSGACAQAWPPFTVSGGQIPSVEGDVQQSLIGVITRSEGSTQVTYRDWPLYYFISDSNPGDTTGQGINSFGEKWYLVKPDGSALNPNS